MAEWRLEEFLFILKDIGIELTKEEKFISKKELKEQIKDAYDHLRTTKVDIEAISIIFKNLIWLKKTLQLSQIEIKILSFVILERQDTY